LTAPRSTLVFFFISIPKQNKEKGQCVADAALHC